VVPESRVVLQAVALFILVEMIADMREGDVAILALIGCRPGCHPLASFLVIKTKTHREAHVPRRRSGVEPSTGSSTWPLLPPLHVAAAAVAASLLAAMPAGSALAATRILPSS